MSAPARVSAITDTTVWSGGRWLDHRDVLLADGRVRRVVPAGSTPDATRPRPGRAVLDGSGGHLIPGLVNSHTHLHQARMRGIGEGLPLLDWLRLVGEETVALTPEQAYTAAAAGAVEALRSGTTTLVEHMWPHPSTRVHDAVLRALRDTGVRAVLCRGVADRPDPTRAWGFDPRLMQPLEEALDHADDLAARVRGSRISVGLAVPNPRSATPEGLRRVRARAEARSMPVSLHLLETETDDLQCRSRTGSGAVDYLAAADFLWDRLLAVHCVHLDGAGRDRLAGHGVAVSYNPLSNMRLGSGVADVPAMLAAGLRVGIGVDGAASNDTQDTMAALRMGSYLQRAVRRESDLLGFAEMMAMAGTGANRALGLEECPHGVVPGTRADLVLHRFGRDFATLPVRDPGATLLTCAGPRTVDTVLVDGEVVVTDGRHRYVDESALARDLAGTAR